MDEEEHNNPGEFVSWADFNRFIKSQDQLCKSFRSHQDTKITNMEKNIKFSMYLVGAIISFLTIINMYMNFIGAW